MDALSGALEARELNCYLQAYGREHLQGWGRMEGYGTWVLNLFFWRRRIVTGHRATQHHILT